MVLLPSSWARSCARPCAEKARRMGARRWHQQQQQTPDSSCRTTTLLCHLFCFSSLHYCRLSLVSSHDYYRARSLAVTSEGSGITSIIITKPTTRRWKWHGTAFCVCGSLPCVSTVCFRLLEHGKGEFLLLLLLLLDGSHPTNSAAFFVVGFFLCSFPPHDSFLACLLLLFPPNLGMTTALDLIYSTCLGCLIALFRFLRNVFFSHARLNSPASNIPP